MLRSCHSSPGRDSVAQSKQMVQLIWGVALVLAGVGVLYRIPQVMPRIESLYQLSSGTAIVFIRFCFYFLAVLLMGGGSKKIYDIYRKLNT